MGWGIGSRVLYKHTTDEEWGTITNVNEDTGEFYIEWDDEIDDGWYYEYDLKD